MKFNIQKLQSGGGFYSPHYIINAPQQVQARPEQSGISPNAKLMDDELYKKLMEGPGLTSDARIVAQEIIEFEQNPMNFLNPNNSEKLKLAAKIGELKNQKESFSFALQNAKEKGTLGEVAIGSGGSLFVRDKDNNIRQIGLDEYTKNRNSYNPMTVAQLLNARQMENQLAFNTDVYNVANNSISLNSVLDKVDKILTDAKRTSREESYYQQDFKTKEEFEELQKVLRSGVSKVTQSVSGLSTAGNYIKQALTPAEWSRLLVHGKLSGVKGNNPVEILLNAAIEARTEVTTKSEEGKFGKTSGDGSSDGTGKSGGLSTMGLGELSLRGLFPSGQTFNWNSSDPDSNIKLSVPVMSNFKIVDSNRRPMNEHTISQFMDKSIYSGVTETQNISFGNVKVSPSDRNKIAISSDEAYLVYLPLKQDGTADLSQLPKVQQVLEKIKADFKGRQDVSVDELNKYYADAGLDVQFDESGKIVGTNSKPFIVTYGWTTDESSVITRDNKKGFVNQLKSSEESQIEEVLKPIFEKEVDGEKGEMPLGSLWETWYKGIITIPLQSDAVVKMAAAENNLYNEKNTLMDARIEWNTSNARNVPANINAILNK